MSLGATPRILNTESVGDYVHEVEYEGHLFQAGTAQLVDEFNVYQKKIIL